MTVSAIPLVIDALVAAAPALMPSGVEVFDAFGLSGNTGNFLMIGVDDPNTDQAARSATSTQDWAHLNNFQRDQLGSISCVAQAWTGDDDQKIARDAAYAIVNALATWVRAHPDLGIVPASLSYLLTGFAGTEDLDQQRANQGAIARVTFQISFHARV